MSTQPVPIPQGATIGNPNAVPIPQGASIGQPDTASQPQATDNQGMLSGMTGLPSQSFSPEQKQDFDEGKSSGTVSGATDATTMAVAGPVLSKAADIGGAALQPVKDAIVNELPYLKSSPSLYVEHIARQAMQWVIQNPDKALKLATSSGVLAAAAKVLLSRSGI